MATKAVLFDLFGTLVSAPSPAQRSVAAATLGRAAGCSTSAVEHYLDQTWAIRHDGTLPTVDQMARHMLDHIGVELSSAPVATAWRRLTPPRIVPDASVLAALTQLRDAGLSIGVVSDASPEIAEAWLTSSLSQLVDHAVFSCVVGAVKPSPRIFNAALDLLSIDAHDGIYVGDGGGDELRGAQGIGMHAIRVSRRGGAHTLAYGVGPTWEGPWADSAEAIKPTCSHEWQR